MSAATVAFTVAFNPAYSMPASEGVSAQNTPLVIVRFNQRKVYYEKSLYNAVSRAVQVKPSVMFSLVAYVPQTRDPLLNQRHLNLASAHLNEVSSNMVKMGVQANRLSLSTRLNPGIKHDEVHLFVR